MSGIVNLCQNGGSGMSICDMAGQGYEQQQRCSFCNGKSAGGNHCINEVFGEYCSRIAAQRQAAGLSINLNEINGYREDEQVFHSGIDNSGRLKNYDELNIEDLADLIESDMEDEEADFHEFVKMTEDVENSMEKRLDEELYYRGPDGIIRKVGDKSDPEYPPHCTTGRGHNHSLTFEEQKAVNTHERFHREIKKFSKTPQPVHEHANWVDNRWGERETILYIMSREINPSVIMERYHAGLMVVVSAETPGLPKNLFLENQPLLLDKEYLVLYTAEGKIAGYATERFLNTVAYMWRKIVPKDALPKYQDRYVNFGFRRSAPANYPRRTIDY